MATGSTAAVLPLGNWMLRGMNRTGEPAAVLPWRTGDGGDDDDDDDDDDGSVGDVGFDAGSVAPAAEDWGIVTGSVTDERTCGAESEVVEVGAADGAGAVEQAATATSVTSAVAAEAVARADQLNRATGAGHGPGVAP